MAKAANSHNALVLPGAVSRGAFEAGVIEALAESAVRIDRIVATSSGALNGVAFAAAIRNGTEIQTAKLLTKTWIEMGSWRDSFAFNPINWMRGRGLSDRSGLLKLLNGLIKPAGAVEGEKRDVELRIIVAPLNGISGAIGDREATTYEKLLSFSGKDFDTEEGLAKIFAATTAACAFPGLYAPVYIPGLGPCVDGGAVNNAPIMYALDENDVSRVLVPVPFPAIMPAAASIHGIHLLNHLIEILINERLYRDLKNAQTINRDIKRLRHMVDQGKLSEENFHHIQSILEIREVDIFEIRPQHALCGNAFSGFFSKRDRIRLVEAGKTAARLAVQEMPKSKT
jgi:predicted acylesterase/phospholipase RssA